MTKKLYYPPGGILIWLIIILEIFTFLGAILVFLYSRKENLADFEISSNTLNPIVGTLNSIVLITSGYFMAESINRLKENQNQKAAKNILIGLVLGLVFLAIKGSEYALKIEAGYTLGYDTYFTFYWLLTGFHFVHVLFGIGMLGFMYSAVKQKKYDSNNYADVESSAVYWHMCDLIWILIFPILYLI
ncbi:MAG: cytochrome c oxidase subunit 3 [Salibacteraceae bacterium]